jgi:hypothetical protein
VLLRAEAEMEKGLRQDRSEPVAALDSDGVVPYWSSHLGGAKSEYHRPVGPQHAPKPRAIEDVRCILTLVARSRGRGWLSQTNSGDQPRSDVSREPSLTFANFAASKFFLTAAPRGRT